MGIGEYRMLIIKCIVVVLVVVGFVCGVVQVVGQVKNVIFFFGDGMGLMIVIVSWIYKVGELG